MRAYRLLGNESAKLTFETLIRRSTPATFELAVEKAPRTESSNPNSRKAASTDNSVNRVRALRRIKAAQMRCRYFMPAPAQAR